MRKRTILALLGGMLIAVLVAGATTGCGSNSKKQIDIQIFPADTNAAAALEAGKVDAYFADATPVLYYIKKTGGKFQVAGKQIDSAPEGIATRKGDPLGPAFKTAISTLYSNGEMQKILAKWGLTEFALQGNTGSATTSSAPVGTGDTINFCSDTTYPPMESIVNGKAAGADVDIANAIAKLWGKKATITTTGFDVLIPALDAKRCDAVISAMTDTAERAKKVDFADYVTVGMLLMVKKGNPEKITSLNSLAGKSVAVEAATTEKDRLDQQNKILAGKK